MRRDKYVKAERIPPLWQDVTVFGIIVLIYATCLWLMIDPAPPEFITELIYKVLE